MTEALCRVSQIKWPLHCYTQLRRPGTFPEDPSDSFFLFVYILTWFLWCHRLDDCADGGCWTLHTPKGRLRVSELFLERLLGSSWLKQTVHSAMLWDWICLHWAVSVLSDELKLSHYHKSFLWYVWDMTIWFHQVVHIGIKFQCKVAVLKQEHFIYLLGHYYYMCYYYATRFLKWKFLILKTTFSV